MAFINICHDEPGIWWGGADLTGAGFFLWWFGLDFSCEMDFSRLLANFSEFCSRPSEVLKLKRHLKSAFRSSPSTFWSTSCWKASKSRSSPRLWQCGVWNMPDLRRLQERGGAGRGRGGQRELRAGAAPGGISRRDRDRPGGIAREGSPAGIARRDRPGGIARGTHRPRSEPRWAGSSAHSHPSPSLFGFGTSCRREKKKPNKKTPPPLTFYDREGGWFSVLIWFVRICTLTILSPELGLSCTYVCHISIALWDKMELYAVNPNLGAGMTEGVRFLSLLTFFIPIRILNSAGPFLLGFWPKFKYVFIHQLSLQLTDESINAAESKQ